jgi:hypothetical protein
VSTDVVAALLNPPRWVDPHAKDVVLFVQARDGAHGMPYPDAAWDRSPLRHVMTNTGGLVAPRSDAPYMGAATVGFDNTNAYLQVNSSNAPFAFLHDGTTPYTIDGVLKVATQRSDNILLDNAGGTTSSKGIYVAINSGGQLRFQMYRGDSVNTVIALNSTPVFTTAKFQPFRIDIDTSLGSANAVVQIGEGADYGTSSHNKSAHAPVAGNATHSLQIGRYVGQNPPAWGNVAWLRITKARRVDPFPPRCLPVGYQIG